MAKSSPNFLLMGVGTMLTSMIAAGFILGYLVDLWLDTQPAFLLVMGFLGFVGGIIKVYEMMTSMPQ